jgi:hypothetical protein
MLEVHIKSVRMEVSNKRGKEKRKEKERKKKKEKMRSL